MAYRASAASARGLPPTCRPRCWHSLLDTRNLPPAGDPRASRPRTARRLSHSRCSRSRPPRRWFARHRALPEGRERSARARRQGSWKMSTGEFLLRAVDLTKKVSSPEGELTILDCVTIGVAARPHGRDRRAVGRRQIDVARAARGPRRADLRASVAERRGAHGARRGRPRRPAQSRSRFRFSIVSPVTVIDGDRERASAARARRDTECARRARGKRSWTSASSIACATIRSNSRAARSSASPSRAHSSPARRCCSPTSRRAISTTRPERGFSISCST